MSIKTTTALSRQLDQAGQQLDITTAQQREIEKRYRQIAEWLQTHYEGRVQLDIYPQGSFRLGTVVAPIACGGQYDLDFVYLRHLQKSSTTQEGLRTEVGDQLAAAAKALRWDPPLELGRCWRLEFFDHGFHFDVLPSIPDEEATDENGILLSDKGLRDWLYSNPKGYAEWFYQRMNQAQLDYLKRADANVEGIPVFPRRTTLQRVVQLLKRSRDHYFNTRTDAPPSVLITTLAAHAYRGQEELDQAFRHVAQHLGDGVRYEKGKYWVPNPAHPEENFADKWNSDPARRDAFYEWLGHLNREMRRYGQAIVEERKFDVLATIFGDTIDQQRAVLRDYTILNVQAVAQGKAKAPLEENIEDLVEIHLTGTVDVELTVTNAVLGKSGRAWRTLKRRRMDRGWDLRFEVTSTTVEPPFEVWWKIRNHGPMAAQAGPTGLRGQIVRNAGLTREEGTKYKGEHYAECYIVKDGVCRARKRVWVPIK